MIALALPAVASAHITSNTSASSQTGGNVVGPGGKVTTGDTSASVSTSNVSGHSTSEVYIKTNTDGEVHEETHTSSASSVGVSVQASPMGTTVEVHEDGETHRTEIPASAAVSVDAAATATASTTGASTTPVADTELGLGASIVLAVQNFFAGILSWFK